MGAWRNKIVSNLSKALFDSDFIATRLILAAAEFLWAMMLFWPGDTFGRPTYTVLANVASEKVWGFIFLTSSLLQLSIVLYNQYGKPWAQVFANWNAVLWVFVVGASIASVHPPPAAMGGEIALAMAAVWVWLRPLIIREVYVRAAIDSSCFVIEDRRKVHDN